MKQKERQEIFDFFTDNLAQASQEFQNKVKESKIYTKIQKELNKYVRIPVVEFPTRAWLLENDWKDAEFFPGFYQKGKIKISYRLNKFVFHNEKFEVIFEGTIFKEKDFLTVEKLVTI